MNMVWSRHVFFFFFFFFFLNLCCNAGIDLIGLAEACDRSTELRLGGSS